MICVINGRVFSQFFLDHLQLFPQDIILLVFVDLFLHFLLELIFDAHDLKLIGDNDAERLIAFFQFHRFQQALFILIIEGQIDGNLIHQFFQIIQFQKLSG